MSNLKVLEPIGKTVKGCLGCLSDTFLDYTVYMVAQPMGGIPTSLQAGAHADQQLYVLTSVWRLWNPRRQQTHHYRLLIGVCNTTE